ncbi:MAG: aminotransferase class V-fold PLP-dependent enzyme [Gemmatimonadetes bacterium]|nr:aminotransferase class V-fold PLP-dependent enzyme [Gemmatimonadota bacterium]MBI2614994.1 aminotransferase class V-fold PLP-dependent enzyme [Gemmatimonadota bacterium]
MFEATGFLGNRSAEEVAADEDYWFEIQQAFTVDRSIVNLNNGGVSPSPRIVQDAMRRYLEYSNQAPVYTMWQVLEPQIESVRRRLAAAFGCDAEEMAITRNASEALEICQLGLDLKPGDEVLTTDHDYPRMLTTWEQRVRRDGIVLKKVPFPAPPPSLDYLVDLFAKGITPKTRVIHFCHITNLSGQIFPVKEICQLARSRGIEAIVDGAHAFAHFPFQRDDLACDYYGTSLHKWLLAPHGTGFLYVRQAQIDKLWPMMAAPAEMNGNIRKFEEIGTHPAANHNAIAEALTFHQGIGAERKAARLRYLRDRWMKRLDGQPRVKLHTSYDPAQSCGLANVEIEGLEPAKIAGHLWEKKRIIVTAIGHPACNGLRITPNVYTTLDEVDTFVAAMEGIIRNGLA